MVTGSTTGHSVSTASRIEKLLKDTFHPSVLRVSDHSELHESHAEAQRRGGGHFEVEIVSEAFDGLSLLKRHKLVNEALRDEFDGQAIHALSLKVYGTSEQ